ncbi:uncharacterized protein LOC108736329 isoform X2 [Agrilus planipennis]|uniref:Uncharacterized protein LOC108736329 isoform X2 n=1 Tax=Agrilus planipennis TaxID=224129 RepID=A0A1W4WJW3_AGRPL|nr:uncharacterized protein LOC108736329 isoform X2 [Agrilus planipennis]XP_018324235.1 uncharacterized protein LOC108736329 isoform X2 [Agrilus planipennis]XP_018324243.1 uncharacterized protein LOC108736329 isoform X2 [Agrilus planipennis]XP_018324251.1 uncharacterized protein LOC108736329 isoform X2 [Agrilus planipennis]
MMPKVPEPILEFLKCEVCSCWLSCGPVLVLPSFKSICGRCSNNANILQLGPQSKLRHVTYELLASFYKFPCIYWSKHCPGYLDWDDSTKHEDNCLYGTTVIKYCAKPQLMFKQERKLNLAEDITLYDIPDNLLEQLKCYLCEGYLSCNPIVITGDGKNICHRCVTTHGVPEGRVWRHTAFEILLETFIFPCIYKFRGCTIRYRFGEQMWTHEIECSYGRIFKKAKNVNANGKERGVIETHTGHIYATLTPNKPLFAPPDEVGKQGPFLSEFQRHRESLVKKWGNNGTDRNGNVVEIMENKQDETDTDSRIYGQQNGARNMVRYDSVEFGNTIRNNLIDELKTKQKQRSDDIISISSSARLSDYSYHSGFSGNRPSKPKKFEYSVY